LCETIINILTRDRAKPGGVATAASTRELRRLEQDSPGITELHLDDDGGIVIPPEDWNALGIETAAAVLAASSLRKNV
jgi:hypothetical protein